MQETRILSRINRQKLLSLASASPKHTKFRADVFTILSAFCLVFFVFARYNHTLQRTLGGAAAPIPEDVLLGILLAMALDTGMTALERSDARALQRL